jgi:hypothetical protein
VGVGAAGVGTAGKDAGGAGRAARLYRRAAARGFAGVDRASRRWMDRAGMDRAAPWMADGPRFALDGGVPVMGRGR